MGSDQTTRLKREQEERERERKIRVEVQLERDAEWIEWAANGKDPNKMPSKINPVVDKVAPKKQLIKTCA